MKITIQLSAGNILKSNTKEERIIHVDDTFVVTVDLGTTKLIFNRHNPYDLIAAIRHKEIIVVEDENTDVFDVDSLPEKYKEIYERNREIVNDFALTYGPYFEEFRKKENENSSREKAKDFGLTAASYMKIIHDYFQSGCSDISLLSKRTPGIYNNECRNYKVKTGRPPKYNTRNCMLNDELKVQFSEGLNELLSGKRSTSILNAYDHIIQKHYTNQVIENGVLSLVEEDEENIPTYRQFYYYVRKNTTKKQFDLIKTSSQEVRNDKRLLLSDTQYGVYGPGDLVEIDACEVDVSLVDIYNPDNTVARPILYLMIDVATRMILAISVAFENNSVLGVTNLFLNLSDDKVEYCKKFGIDLDPSLWKSNIIPRRIRFDRGAECRSNQLEKVLNKLNIERELVTGGTGSLKGNVEQSFHQMHMAQNYLLEDKGLIEKRYDSKHHKEACLTIHDYTKIVINFVLAHNQSLIRNYKSTKDMIVNGIPAIPVKLWDYLASKSGLPRQITTRNVNQFRYDLLQEFEAKVSREGISFIGGHLYYNEDDEKLQEMMYDAGDTKQKFPVRYDPRNMNYLYYLQDNKLMVATLNMKKSVNEGFENLTLTEMRNLDLKNKKILNGALIDNEKIRRSRDSANKAIIDNAVDSRTSIKANDKDLRENREIAKQDYRYDNSVASRFGLENDITAEETTETQDVEVVESKPTTNSRFEELKAIGYLNLTPEQQQEYADILDEMVNDL